MDVALDPQSFDEFAEDVGSVVIALEFLTTFASLLAGRIRRIEGALKDQDREETLTALLSLHASATMAGATQLQVSVTRALANEMVETTPPGPLVRKLEGQADLFRTALTELHSHHPITSVPTVVALKR
jgi:HPt (histidine-containing phosphotransfer) domain-containing protein